MFNWCWHKWKPFRKSWVEYTLGFDRFHTATGKECAKCGKKKGRIKTTIIH